MLLAAAFFAGPTANASAATTVFGADGPSGPLVIQPEGLERVEGNYGKLFFIQRMPATKVVNRITLGDIALSSSCTKTGPILRLAVAEHVAGSMGTETSSATWEGNALESIPADHEFKPRTWRTEPITFVKGRAYSFWVNGTSSPCVSFDVRSWPHNEMQVNAGINRCDRVRSGDYRMWHEAGQPDAVLCPERDGLPENFDPSMPEGWLLTYESSVQPAHDRAAAAPPIAQLLGAPLRSGDRVILRGRTPAGTIMLVRTQLGHRIVEARLNVGRRVGRSVLRVSRGRGGPRLVLRPGSGATQP